MSTNRGSPREGATTAARTQFPVIDRDGRTIEITAYGEHLAVDEFEPLVAMYGAFDPADRTLGLPPTDGTAIRDWLRTLLDGQNVLAWHDDAVAGHAVLFRVASGAYELGAFVHRAYRDSGIGVRLVETFLERGRRS